VVSVELEAEIASGTIMNTSVKGVLPLGTKLLDEVMAGRIIGDGPNEAVEEIRQRYVCPSQKALCTAVANAYEAYYRYRQQGLSAS
jgi:hypothetical protein